jgi:competence protein CoiA
MVWVVDGRRRKRDMAQFSAPLRGAIVVSPKQRIVSVPSNEGALLRDWEASRVPVYFDFGTSAPTLWRLDPRVRNGMAYLSPVPKNFFLRVHLEGLPSDERCTKAVEHVAADNLMQQAPRSRPLTGFERCMDRGQGARRRF